MDYCNLISHFLSVAAEELGSRGCNDFSLEPFLSPEDQIKFVSISQELNGTPEDIPEKIKQLPNCPDFVVASTLAHMLRKKK